MGGRGIAATVTGKAGRAGNSDVLENLARVGLVAYGVLHVLVAWLALQLAWGGAADDGRPVRRVRHARPRNVRRAGPAVGDRLGLVALAVWQAAEVLRWRAAGRRRASAGEGDAQVVKAVAKALVYATWRYSPCVTPSAAAGPAPSRSSSTPRACSAGPAGGCWSPRSASSSSPSASSRWSRG